MDRIEDRRRLRQTCKQRRLVERQLPGTPREIGLGGGLDPVGVIAVVNGVHVRAEDPVLGPVASELDSQTGLLDLPLERPLTRDVEVADELLGDRGAALDDLARAQVFDRGTDDALVVDAAVLVEAPVLDRDGGLRHPRAHLRKGDWLPVLLSRDRAEEGTVGGVDERVRGAALRSGVDGP